MIYFISDTHFFHKNIIKYCNRPFNSVEEMNNTIINNWNKTVKKEDIVYHLGDFILNNNELESIVKRLNGKIYFIRGNHDHKSINYYNRMGLNVIPTQTKLDEYKIVLSHRPLSDEQIPKGYKNIHGHIHEKELDENIFDKNKHINVSVDVINFTPIDINKLI